MVSNTREQRDRETEKIIKELPIEPQWGIKANSQHRNNYWFGYKVHLAVASESQYVLSAIFTSAHVADVSVAIPLMRKVCDLGVTGTHVLLDKGYDAQAIYQEALALGLEPIIPLKHLSKNSGEWTDDFAPTCVREQGYLYDSFDKRYNALKFIQPLAKCRDCPLFHEEICQKVIKIKQNSDPRKFNHPARGTKVWNKLYAKRTSVERVNGYWKEHMKLNDTTHFKEQIVQTEMLLIQLVYNLKTYAAQRLKLQRQLKEIVA